MWGAIAAIGGAVISGSMQAGAAEDAANTQAAADREAIAEQKRQYDLSREDLSPWRLQGGAATRRLGELLGLKTEEGSGYSGKANFDSAAYLAANPDVAKAGVDAWTHYQQYGRGEGRAFTPVDANLSSAPPADFGALNRKFTVGDFYADPVTELGLKFGLEEGTKGINRMATRNGGAGLNSGATLKALTRYGTDYTGTKAGESYSRFVNDQTNLYNRLAGISGTGQVAANTTASLGANTATNVGNMITAGGNARGAATIAGGNAYGNAFNTIGNYYAQQQTLDKLINARGGGRTYGMTYGTPGEDYSYESGLRN